MLSHGAAMCVLLLRLGVLLLAQSALRAEELLGGLVLLANAVCVERLACGASERFDANLMLQATLLARLLGFLRSMGQPPPSPIPSVMLGVVWGLLGLFATHHAKRPASGERWLPAYLATACAALTGATYAPMEALWMHGARSVGLAALCGMLYADPPAEGALVGRRGFLLCFLPIMVVHWVVAWVFGATAAFVIAGHEWQAMAEEQERDAGTPPV